MVESNRLKMEKYIEFYGSSSEEANEKHYGGLADYRSSEGKKVNLPLKQSIDKTIRDILGGVRSSCTYVGAPSLKQLSKCTTFVRVNNQYNDTFGKSLINIQLPFHLFLDLNHQLKFLLFDQFLYIVLPNSIGLQ